MGRHPLRQGQVGTQEKLKQVVRKSETRLDSEQSNLDNPAPYPIEMDVFLRATLPMWPHTRNT